MKLLIVDPSLSFRQMLVEAVANIPDMEISGQIQTAQAAIRNIEKNKPDIVIIDIDIKGLDIDLFVEALRQNDPVPHVIVITSLSKIRVIRILNKLNKALYEYIQKPSFYEKIANVTYLQDEIHSRLKAIEIKKGICSILHNKPLPENYSAIEKPPVIIEEVKHNNEIFSVKPGIIVIGSSTGGPQALSTILPHFPEKLGVPILIIQHIPETFTQKLVEALDEKCRMKVCAAENGSFLESDIIYIAPGGKQMRVSPYPDKRLSILITDDPPEHNCRPSVDYLLRSIARHYESKVLAIILTGMGTDGTEGLKLLKKKRCYVLAQDENSSVVFGMARSAIKADLVDQVLPLDKIAGRIVTIMNGYSIDK